MADERIIRVNANGSQFSDDNIYYDGTNGILILKKDMEVYDDTDLGGESLSNGATFAATWGTAGDFAIAAGTAVYTHNTGAGTLTQTQANMTIAGNGNRYYVFEYDVLASSGDAAAQITAAFAVVATDVDLTVGVNKTLLFKTTAAPTDFVISGTSTSGGFTLDNVSLKEVQGGDVEVHGDLQVGAGLIKYGTAFGATPGILFRNPADTAYRYITAYIYAQNLILNGGFNANNYYISNLNNVNGVTFYDSDCKIYIPEADTIGLYAGGSLGATVKQDGGFWYKAFTFIDEFGNGPRTEWATRTTTGAAAAQNAVGGVYRLTTGAVLTNEESLDWNDICPYINVRRPRFLWRLMLEQVTNIEVDLGLIEVSGAGDNDYIMFKFDASAANTWRLEASKAGATATSVGAVATVAEVELECRWTSDTALEWFINGSSQGTITTAANIPTVQMQPIAAVRTEENAAHYIDLVRCCYWQENA